MATEARWLLGLSTDPKVIISVPTLSEILLVFRRYGEVVVACVKTVWGENYLIFIVGRKA